jgi:cytochrome b561
MSWRNSDTSYGIITKIFHWVSVVMVTTTFMLGITMVNLPNDPSKFTLYGWHKSLGIIIFLTIVVRIIWRATNTQPSLPSSTPYLIHKTAFLAHFALYGLLLLIPLTGWSMSSAAGFPVSVFGLFTMPNLVAVNKSLAHFLNETHEVLAMVLLALVVLHVGAAFVHHFIFKDDVLRRMWVTNSKKR